MGVQGLWELLAPVGRRVSVEALSGRKLAIDASIWIIQFMKAMRDDKGDMIRNAHLLGFFRRICKLLYLRVKPVFVFDGGTPALKRRTVIARRRQRERAQSKIRKTAEKLLLNHLRTRKLDEIAHSIGVRQAINKTGEKDFGSTDLMTKGGRAKDGTTGISKEEREGTSSGKGQEASVIIENENVQPLPSCSSSVAHFQLDDNYEDHAALDDIPVNSESDGNDDDDDEYIMLPPSQGRIDPAVLASLPPSMQLNLLVQMREQLVTDNRKRFQKVAKDPAAFSQMQIQAYLKTVAFRRDIDQVQKAAANRGIGGLPSARIASEVDREYIFSANFQPKEPVAQTYEVERNVTHRSGEDILDASETSQSLGLHGKRMIQQDTIMSEAVSLKETMPDKKPADEHESVEDKEIDWEDGENFVSPAPSQPLKGTITIEIDQDEILADIRETQKFGGEGGSESEDIEWEDDALGGEHVNSIAEKSIPTTGLEYKSEDNFLNLGGNNREALNETLREAEEAELEEAIRQSLQDYKSCKGQDSVVENELVVDLMEKNITSLNNNVSESPLSEKVYLASARERKGEVVVEDNKTMCQEGTCLQEIKEFTRKSSDSTELSDHDVNSCTVSLSEVNVAIPLGSRLHVDAKVVEAHANDSITGSQTSASEMDFNLMSGKSLCRDAPLSKINTANDMQIETDCIMQSKVTTVSPQLPNMGELRTEAPCFNNAVSRVGEFNKENKNGHDNELASSLQASYDNLELVGMQTNTPVESEKIPSSFSVNRIGKEDEQLQEALLKEAEEININAEREALAQQERDLQVEREELSCQQAELQALIESEQAAIQARLQEERDLLLEEEIELRASQRKNERNAESVSGEMFSECQELLQMFGIPYIIAPMEAEAQCAYMDSIGLVDGVITDDCDVFLFGGRNVFKNIFDDRKYVETYYMKDVENELGLDQEKLIHMALLLGSDYTEGISGIGIVNAIEVVNSFEGEEGLQKFREWLDAPDATLLERINQDGPKKHAEKKTEQGNESQDNINLQEVDGGGSQDTKYNSQQRIFMQKHRAVSKNWNFPESFPNPMVINAYKSPQVDTSSEAFTWGRPDLEVLRRLCLEKFGWDRSKSEELLLPVLKEYDRRETQLRLEAFYSFNERFAKIRSKRIQKAVTRKTGQLPSELVDFPIPENSEELISVEDERDCLSRENRADAKLKSFTKASAKNSVGIRRNKQKSNKIQEGVQEVSTHRRVAARGRSKTSRGRARPSVRSVSRLSVETLSSDGSSGQEEASDHKKCKGKVRDSMPRRSNRQTERVIYNYSGSEDDNDNDWKEELQTREQPYSFSSVCTTGRKNAKESALFTSGTNSVSETESTQGCGIGASMTGNFMTQEDESHVYTGGFSAADAHGKKAKSVLIASNRVAEAERNKDDSEILACSANDQQDFQGQEDTNYLSMGGGFCTNADDASLEKSSHAFAISGKTMEGFVDDNESVGLLEELQSSVRSLASSTSAPANVFSSASEDHLTREESALCAIPSLRRKKRRVT